MDRDRSNRKANTLSTGTLDLEAIAALKLLRQQFGPEHGDGEVPDVGYYTAAQWAERLKLGITTARRFLTRGVRTGIVEAVTYRTCNDSRMTISKFYRMKQ